MESYEFHVAQKRLPHIVGTFGDGRKAYNEDGTAEWILYGWGKGLEEGGWCGKVQARKILGTPTYSGPESLQSEGCGKLVSLRRRYACDD